jgi:PhnB protein
MAPTVKPIPPQFHSVTPYICVKGASKAIEFYKKAFGAQDLFRLPMPGEDGKIMHAEIKIGDSIIMINDEMPQMNHLSPETRGGPTGTLHLFVEDVDAAFDKAVKAGCTVRQPVSNMFWGDRYGQVTDPFGHVWSLATHVEDIPHGEIPARFEIAMKEMAGAAKK